MRTAVAILVATTLMVTAVMLPAIAVVHFGLQAEDVLWVSAILAVLGCVAPAIIRTKNPQPTNLER